MVYAILATAILGVLVVSIHNRDRDAQERDERIEQVCQLARRTRTAVKINTEDTPIATFGFPQADRPIVQYNENIARRNARAEKFLAKPLPDGCAVP